VSLKLEKIQATLLDVGSHIATPRIQSSLAHLERTKFDQEHTKLLENWIDEMDEQLPPLRNFILPVTLIFLARKGLTKFSVWWKTFVFFSSGKSCLQKVNIF